MARQNQLDKLLQSRRHFLQPPPIMPSSPCQTLVLPLNHAWIVDMARTSTFVTFNSPPPLAPPQFKYPYCRTCLASILQHIICTTANAVGICTLSGRHSKRSFLIARRECRLRGAHHALPNLFWLWPARRTPNGIQYGFDVIMQQIHR
jgi:hypothetical protein